MTFKGLPRCGPRARILAIRLGLASRFPQFGKRGGCNRIQSWAARPRGDQQNQAGSKAGAGRAVQGASFVGAARFTARHLRQIYLRKDHTLGRFNLGTPSDGCGCNEVKPGEGELSCRGSRACRFRRHRGAAGCRPWSRGRRSWATRLPSGIADLWTRSRGRAS